jgi:hypothetical protein
LHHLTLDARISHLGGKDVPRGRVPTRIVRGIEAAKTARERKLENEAQEAGILLPVKKRERGKQRERGLNTSGGVGKFKNGMLKINDGVIKRINGTGGVHRGTSIKKLFK